MIESDTVLVIAPSVPYMAVIIAQAFDAYNGSSLTSIAMVAGVIISALYPICGLVCKKKASGMLIAAVLFIVDFIGMLILTHVFMDSMMSSFADIVAHAVILFMLISGWQTQKKYHSMMASFSGMGPENF